MVDDEMAERIRQRRERLFRSGWKNKQPLQPLVNREETEMFTSLVEWCEEFEGVVGQYRERLSDPDPRIGKRHQHHKYAQQKK